MKVPSLERLSEQSETPLVRFIKYSFMVMIMNNQLNYSYDKVEGELGGRGEFWEEGGGRREDE